MVTKKYLQWLTGIALVTALTASAQADRMLARHQDLEAFVPDNAACGPTYQVIIRTTDSSSFSGGKTKVQRLLGGIRAILSLECPQAKNIIITGQVQGQEVYRGAASATGNWALVDIPEAPKKIAQVTPQTSVPAHASTSYLKELEKEKERLTAEQLALKKQIERDKAKLEHAKKVQTDNTTTQVSSAAPRPTLSPQGPPSKASNNLKTETSKDPFARFEKPSEQAPNTPQSSTPITTQMSTSSQEVDFSKFARSDFIQGIYTGDFYSLDEHRYYISHYLLAMNEFFLDQALYIDPECSLLGDAEMPKHAGNIVLGILGGGSLDNPDHGGMVENTILGVLELMKEGPGGIIQLEVDEATVKRQGAQDAKRFVLTYKCNHPVTERFYENAKRFIRQLEPAYTSNAPDSAISPTQNASAASPRYTNPFMGMEKACNDAFADKPRDTYAERRGQTVEKHCNCMAGAIQKSGLSQEDATRLYENYGVDSLREIAPKYPKLGKMAGDCYY